MRKVLLSIGLAALMCGTSGCFSMGNAIAGAGDGSTGGGDEATALMLDVITLPVQAAALIVVGTGGLIWLGGELVVEGTEKLFE